MGRPSLPPRIYFRLQSVGYFEGPDSERGIARRAADSFAMRDFLGIGLDSAPPDRPTISRTRRFAVQGVNQGDKTMIQTTQPEAAEQLQAVAAVTDDAVAVIEKVVADKGYHSRRTVHDLQTLEIRTYIS